MPTQRQDDPISKMFIEGYKDTIFRNSPLQDLLIIRSGLTCFQGTDNIMALTSQGLSHIQPKHLIEVKFEWFRRQLLSSLYGQEKF